MGQRAIPGGAEVPGFASQGQRGTVSGDGEAGAGGDEERRRRAGGGDGG
jgi:hypothetical protein